MTALRPTLIFVHGAWHGPWAWDRLRTELGDFTTTGVSLPSSGPDPSALGSFSDDVAAVRAAVSAVNGPAVVIAHSYGGVPATEAACGLENVAGVIYVAAFVLDVGQPAAAVAAGGGVPEWWDVHPDEGYVDARRAEEIFYGDLPAPSATEYAARLTHQSLASGAQPLTDAAWKYVPTSYVVCDLDASLPPAAQDEMAQRTGRVHHLAAGHSPFLSRPAELAELIRADVADFADSPIVNS
ncbi:alpha/beta hydrolase [Nocardia sp. NPDC049737]|uniref:Alpha/beta hydrolase n=1 Tax=Nocardia vinacea TaxID=96468 RepID=A0ABZ1YQ86_9NOCA|nr:alpha/beta hydrolase [Nocardia vinacea]